MEACSWGDWRDSCFDPINNTPSLPTPPDRYGAVPLLFTEGAAEKFRIEGFDLRIAMTEAQGHFWSRA